MTKIKDYVIEVGLIAIIFLTPLAFGTVEVWSIAVLEIIVALLFIFWILSDKEGFKQTVLSNKTFLLPLVIYFLFVLFQIAPLPKLVLKVFSINSYNLYNDTLSIFSEWDWRALSVNFYITYIEIIRLFAYLLFFVLILGNAKAKNKINRLIFAIIFSGFIIALIGIIQKYTWNYKLLWFRKLSFDSSPFGPFVNRNHAAGYLSMIVPLVIGQLLVTKDIGKKVLLGFIASIISAGIFISLSRGGIICFLWTIFTMCVLLVIFGNKLKSFVIMLSIAIFLVVFVNWLGKDEIVKRVATIGYIEGIDSVNIRTDIWRDTLKIVKDFPVTGTGLGTFSHIFPKYKNMKLQLFFTHTENDYLQLLSETGLVGFLTFIAFLLLFTMKSIKRLIKERDIQNREVLICFFSSYFGILIFSFLDFSLHITANALLLMFIISLTINTFCLNGSEKNGYPYNSGRNPVGKDYFSKGVVIFVSIYVFAVVGIFAGDRYARKNDFKNALLFNPFNPHYYYLSGKNTKVVQYAKRMYEKSVQLSPSNGRYLLSLGGIYTQLSDYEKSEKMFSRSFKLINNNDPYYFYFAGYYFNAEGQKAKAKDYFKKALELDPGYANKISY